MAAQATGSVRSAICLAEDRSSEEEAIRVCVASAQRSNPGYPILAYLPNASTDLRNWLARVPQCTLRSEPLPGKYGWNVKPQALLSTLAAGYEEAWWIDSDVLVRRSLQHTYRHLSGDTLLAAEEALSAAYADYGQRARGWGFAVARHFRFNLNSCVLRVSRVHIELLSRWQALLDSPEYRAAQGLDWRVCPPHMLGDQDVLTALLCAVEFAHVPVHVLRRGPDIIQYYGLSAYTLRERLGNAVNGGPTFVHSQGFKPWRRREPQLAAHGVRRLWQGLLSDASAYLVEASKLGLTGDMSWVEPRTAGGRMLRRLGLGNRVLTGLPLAAAADLLRLLRPHRTRGGTQSSA